MSVFSPSSLTPPSGARLTGSAAAVAGEPGEAGGAGEAAAGGGGRDQGALPRHPHPEAGGAPLNPNPKSELFEAKAVLKSLGLTL